MRVRSHTYVGKHTAKCSCVELYEDAFPVLLLKSNTNVVLLRNKQ